MITDCRLPRSHCVILPALGADEGWSLDPSASAIGNVDVFRARVQQRALSRAYGGALLAVRMHPLQR